MVGRKFIIFLYPGGNASRAARWDLAYLKQCVYDLCSNGILIDTVGADDMLRLPTDDANNNKQKQSNTKPSFSGKCPFPFYQFSLYLHNSIQPRSFPNIAPFFSLRLQSQKYQSLINSNYPQSKPTTSPTHKAADPNKLSRLNSTWSLSGLTKWSN